MERRSPGPRFQLQLFFDTSTITRPILGALSGFVVFKVGSNLNMFLRHAKWELEKLLKHIFFLKNSTLDYLAVFCF